MTEYQYYDDCENCGFGLWRVFPLSPLWNSAEPPEEELAYYDWQRVILQCVNCELKRLFFIIQGDTVK
jgi:hypothetical protein